MRRVRAIEIRATGYALVLALAGLLFALMLGNGCGRRSTPPTRPNGNWAPSWLEPRGEEPVAGSVPLEVTLPPGATADEVRFSIDGAEVGAARGAPWSLRWEAPQAGDARSRVFSARAYRLGEAVSDSASIAVMVEPDSAPRAWIELPGRALWIEQGRGATLLGHAVDPEEGALSEASCRWRTELLPQPVSGAVLSTDALAEGTQRVAFEAEDRWLRAARVELKLTPFHYREMSEPANCIWNLAAALQAMDVARVQSCFDEDFRFIPCGADGPWTENEVARALATFCANPRVSRVECQWEAGAVRYVEINRVRHAFCEVHLVGQHYRIDADSTEGAASAEGRTVSSREGRMTFEMIDRGSGWHVVVWREEAPKIGPSLADVIRAGGALPENGRPPHRACD